MLYLYSQNPSSFRYLESGNPMLLDLLIIEKKWEVEAAATVAIHHRSSLVIGSVAEGITFSSSPYLFLGHIQSNFGSKASA